MGHSEVLCSLSPETVFFITSRAIAEMGHSGAVFFISRDCRATNAAEAHVAARSAGGGRVLRAPPSARAVYSSASKRHGHSVCVVECEQTDALVRVISTI